MKKSPQPKNKIKELRQKKGLSSGELAELIGTSKPHMSRLENGKSPLDADWILKISGALNVPTGEVANVNFGKKFNEVADDTMVGVILGDLLTANDKYNTKLKNDELSKLASYIYKRAKETSLNAQYVRDLTYTVVEVVKLSRKLNAD